MILYILLAAGAMIPAWIIDRADRTTGAAGAAGGNGAAGSAGRTEPARLKSGVLTRGGAVSFTCFLILFAMLFIPAALRQATGNDYMRYVEFFHLAQYDLYVPTEAGFNLFVKLIYRLCGYENYLLVFALFSAATIAFFLLAIRQQAENFAASFFLFMMFGYYFQSFNTVRYYFALAVTVFSIRSFMERRYAAFAALIVLAALFHKSALIVLILYPAARHVWKKREIIAAGIFGVSLIVLHSFWLKVFLKLYPSWQDTQDLAAGTSVSFGNILRCLLVLALYLYAEGKGRSLRKALREPEEEKLRFYLNCTVLGLMIYVCGWFIPEVSRLCYYMTFTQIWFIPLLAGRISEGEERRKTAGRVRALIAAGAVLSFAVFLHNASDPYIKVLPYRTFLFHELPQTPSRSIEIQQRY